MSDQLWSADSFDLWFAQYSGSSQEDIQLLLDDPAALRFLIAWSTFESKACRGEIYFRTLPALAQEFASKVETGRGEFSRAASHFHARYQDDRRYSNLLHDQKDSDVTREFDRILTTSVDILSDEELIFFLLVVIYRFRNNIFHGNKGVESWLQYREQIWLCIGVMQLLIGSCTAGEADE